MLAHHERMDVLRSLGLTRSEARAYLALLEVAEAKASAVARASKVPRGRIYDVLDRLHEKGLVDLLPTTPRLYRAAPLASFLGKRREALRAQADELGRTLESIASEFTPQAGKADDSGGEFLVFRKRRAVIRKMREMIERATQEVYISCSESCAIRGERGFLAVYQDRAAAGVELRMSCNVTEHNLAAIKALQKFLKIRHQEVENAVTSILVVDGKEALLAHWNPDDEDLFLGNDVAIWCNDSGAVWALREVLRDAWERGSDPVLRYLEIEEGIPHAPVAVMRGPRPMEQALVLAAKMTRAEAWGSTLNSLVNAEGDHFMSALKPLSRRTVQRRLLVAYDGGSLEGAWRVADLGSEVRVSESVTRGRYLGIDRSQVFLFVESMPPSHREAAGHAEKEASHRLIVRVTDRGAVEAFRAAFVGAWEHATPLEQFAARAKEGTSTTSPRTKMEAG